MKPPDPSSTHLVLIPSYNPGRAVIDTAKAARRHWNPVWLVVDGSTDGSVDWVQQMAASDPGLRVLVLPENRGKGAALLEGMNQALQQGFTHALTMDSDGQHPADLIPAFMAASQAQPGAMVLGRPIFGADAPLVRVRGRKLSNAWANLETLWAGIGDSLFGFRVYPMEPLTRIMQSHRFMRRYDFDPEAAVRMCWAGVKPLNIDAPVRYPSKAAGGISHFHYLRDNCVLAGMHSRLFAGFLLRLPQLAWRTWRSPLIDDGR